MKRGHLLDRHHWLHRIWLEYGDGWPYDDPRRRWVPAGVNRWLGNRRSYPPMWIWRWVCWWSGHEDDSYGDCAVCRKALR